MTFSAFVPYLLVMALVTYLIRMLPLVLMRKQIRNRFLKSFLQYIPYTVLTAMIVPDIVYSTGYVRGGDPQALISALAGMIAGVLAAWRGKGLLFVAIAACLGVAAAQGILMFF